MVSSIKMSYNRIVVSILSKALFLTERRCSTNLSHTTINARNAVNDVGGGGYKIVPNNEIGFRSGNWIRQS